MLRKVVPAQVTALGDHEVEVRMSTGALGRDGHVLVPQGAELGNYRANPIMLWQHDPMAPVARAEDVRADGEAIAARAIFAPAGISAKADEIRGLVKAGIINAVSVGFDPLDGEPLDPKRPRGGQRFTRWELLECSFVSVPADPGAMVTARAQGDNMAEWKVGAARDLAVEDSDSWDGPAAEKSIFEYAGGDEFEPAKARRGFLVYNAAEPKLRGSYKLPIAHVVDGELKVPKGAIRAAASRLPQADLPDEVRERAQAVIDHYKQKAGIGAEGAGGADGKESKGAKEKGYQAPMKRSPGLTRGMYAVAQLAWLFDCICNAHSSSEIEEALEGDDDSALPALLMAVKKDLGEALIAMTVEEVAEMCADGGDDGAGADGGPMMMGGKAKLQRFRAAYMRAGKALSAANAARLEQAQDHHKRALEHHAAAETAHASLGEHHQAIADAHSSLRAAHERLGDALEEARAVPGDTTDPLDRCMRAHRAMARGLDAIADHNTGLGDDHEAVGDAHRGIKRCVRAAQRCVRAVAIPGVDGHEIDADSHYVQTSAGDANASGSEGGRNADYRRRQAELLALSAA